ncbi:MAG TPA: biopolymer transporter ExbD [Allosphingosinicella sp.]|nr:biopolymer transporter ExbD [Allosphingosinicella sp.]
MMRPRRIAFASAPDQPIATVNTTPLIDVMLVLLIMFIITMPLATHAVKIDLPQNGPAPKHEPKVHRIDLDAAGRTLWDGAPVGSGELHRRLDAFRAARDDGLLELRSDGAARYDDFDRLLATIKRSGIERLAFVGNERFAGSAGR